MDSDMSDYFFDTRLGPPSSPSLLYRLPLERIGESDVESLYGYMQRLALAHKVSLKDLMESVFRPVLIEKSMRYGQSPFVLRWLRGHMLGVSEEAERWIEVFEELTNGTNLRQGTLRWMSDCISPQDLISTKHSYCPICLAERVVSGTVEHDPLLMHLKALKVCPWHGVRLVERRCGHSRGSAIPENYRAEHPSACGNCGAIGFSCNRALPVKASAKEVRNAKDLHSLIEFGAKGNVADKETLNTGLGTFLRQRYGGSIHSLAIAAGVPKAVMAGFLEGGSDDTLPLSAILALCAIEDITPVALFSGNVGSEFGRSKCSRSVAVYRGTMSAQEIESEMMQLLSSTPVPFSVSHAEQRLGLNRGFIRGNFRGLYEDLSAQCARRRKDACNRAQRERSVGARAAVWMLQMRGMPLTAGNAWILTGLPWHRDALRAKAFDQAVAQWREAA